MRHYERREVQRKETHLVEQKCDLCGVIAKDFDSWSGGWYVVDETKIQVTVKQKEGNDYPEGGSGTEFNIDLCPKCFKERLVPWLISQGATIEQDDWDW